MRNLRMTCSQPNRRAKTIYCLSVQMQTHSNSRVYMYGDQFCKQFSIYLIVHETIQFFYFLFFKKNACRAKKVCFMSIQQIIINPCMVICIMNKMIVFVSFFNSIETKTSFGIAVPDFLYKTSRGDVEGSSMITKKISLIYLTGRLYMQYRSDFIFARRSRRAPCNCPCCFAFFNSSMSF